MHLLEGQNVNKRLKIQSFDIYTEYYPVQYFLEMQGLAMFRTPLIYYMVYYKTQKNNTIAFI